MSRGPFDPFEGVGGSAGWQEGMPEPLPDIGSLPPPSRRYRRSRRRRSRQLWVKLAVVALPLATVLAVAGIGGRWSHGWGGQQRQQAQASASASGTGGVGGSADGTGGSEVYEAEDATGTKLGTTARVRAAPGASGGKVVTAIGHGTPAGDVTFEAVTADAAGRFTVTIYYLLADTVAHRLALWVNGKGPTILSFPPLGAGAASRIGSLRTTVTLTVGVNTIRFSNATAKYGPDLDRISVQPQPR
jgi:hypothetical protein